MSPQVNHLDQQRMEYHDDGSITERSTREWMSTIMTTDHKHPALCDVVNGPPDHKAYLLVPSHYLEIAQCAWSQYKSRLYPPSHREARFRDNLPGLPNVIHIQAEIAAHESFFEQLSEASVWQPTLQHPNQQPPVTDDGHNAVSLSHSKQRPVDQSSWPTPAEVSKHSHRNRNETSNPQRGDVDVDLQSISGNTSIGTTEDRSTTSTRSITHASRASTTTEIRFQELEQSTQRKLRDLEVSGKQSDERLHSMAQQLTRIDDLDKKVAAVNDKLDLAAEHMKESKNTQQLISADMEDIKTYTIQQFAEMNERLLSNMESQHKMSTTMLDLREHFLKMSAFMESVATKMEYDRRNVSDSLPYASRARAPTSQARGLNPYDSCSTSNASTKSGSSSTSKESVQSTASSMVYRSPEKKKLRSHQKAASQPSITSESGNKLSDEFEEGQRSNYMDICANLNAAFSPQDNPSDTPSSQAEYHSPTEMNTLPPSRTHLSLQHTAPLDPRYNFPTDLAGAAKE